MIDAEMRKKIRKSIDISVQEDVLTSNVFGFMSLVDIHLLTVLSHAKHISSNDALKKVFFNQQIKSQSFSLWKQLKNLNILNTSMMGSKLLIPSWTLRSGRKM